MRRRTESDRLGAIAALPAQPRSFEWVMFRAWLDDVVAVLRSENIGYYEWREMRSRP